MRPVQKMIEAGRLEARKVGRDYIIEASALEHIPKQAAGRLPKAKVAAASKAGKKKGSKASG